MQFYKFTTLGVAVLSVLACRAELEIVDITAAVRNTKAATITTTSTPFGAYDVAGAFDGTFPTGNTTGRWLVKAPATEADCMYVIAEDFEEGKAIVLKEVQVYRQGGSGGNATGPISRAPDTWTVYGRNAETDPWAKIAQQTEATWDSTKVTDYVSTEVSGYGSYRQYKFEFANPDNTNDNSTRLLIGEIVLKGYIADPSEFEVGGTPTIGAFTARSVATGAAKLDWTISGYGNFCNWVDAKILYADNEMFTDAVEVDLGHLTQAPPASGTVELTDLDPKETYYAKLTAVNQVDESVTSDPIAFKVLSFMPDVVEGDDLAAAVAEAQAKIARGEVTDVTLRISQGVYALTDAITITQPVSLVAIDGAEKTHIVQKTNLKNVLTFAAGSAGAVLEGFTLVGSNWGNQTGSNVNGGNLSIQTAGVTVRNCVMTGTQGGGQKPNVYGGGVYMNADSLVENCVISNNLTFKQGAGVYMTAGTVRNCRITANGRPTGGQYDVGLGSGIWMTGGLVTGCVIDHNRSHRAPGAGVVIFGKTARVEQCTIVANTSPEAGAGVLIREGKLVRSIVFGNSAGDIIAQSADQLELVCSPRLLTRGGHIWRNPAFVDFDAGDYRPAANSPVVLEDGTYLGALAPSVETLELPNETPSEETEITVAEGGDLLAAVDDARRRVDAYGNRVTVTVAEGEFVVTDALAVDGAITLKGAGPERTVVSSPALMNRVIAVESAEAHVSGLTFKGGASMGGSTGEPRYYFNGLGLLLTGGMVTNCTMTGVQGGSQNSTPYGGAVRQMGGHLVDCVISNNTATATGCGLYLFGGLAERLVICDNTIATQFATAAGVYVAGPGTLRNSLICRNRVTASGNGKGGVGLTMVNSSSGAGVVDGCTIVDNTNAGVEAGAGARINNLCTLRNSILYGNLTGGVADDLYRTTGASGARVTYCCVPSVTEGEGNITDDPRFTDYAGGDYTLPLTSPCVDRGSNTQADGVLDLAGNPRVTDGRFTGTPTMDIGCYEYAAAGEGLMVTFAASGTTESVGSLTATFTATVIYNGAPLADESVRYRWTLGDGTVVEGAGSAYASVTHSYPTLGSRDVSLTVTYGSETAETTSENLVRVYSDVIYVADPSSGVTPVFPYATAKTATTDLAEAYNAALAAAAAGAEYISIRLLPGEHELTTSVALSFPGEVVGLGATAADVVVKPRAQLLAFALLTDSSKFANFTVRGATRSESGTNVNGASLVLQADALITNCVVEAAIASGHGCSTYGHGLYASKGLVVDCTIRDCLDGSAYRGESTVWLTGTAVADRLRILNNRCGGGATTATQWTSFGTKGAGVTVHGNAVLRNSLVAGNESGYCGGAGVYAAAGGTIENCTIVGNRIVNLNDVTTGLPCNNAEHGAGLYVDDRRVTVRNCIVSGNTRFDVAEDIFVPEGTYTEEIWGHITYTLSPSLANRLEGTGNVADLPVFKNAVAGDYRLKVDSPGHNAGFNADWSETALDLDGCKRRVGRVDMGCYETPSGLALIIK